MITVALRVEGLDRLREAFKRSPFVTLKYLARATVASIFEIEKQAVDRNFQFRTPRALRTGQLANSFAFGRYISPSGLYGSIGPTVHYAPYVYYGSNGRLKPNKYMDRIALAAEPRINQHFQDAVNKILDSLDT